MATANGQRLTANGETRLSLCVAVLLAACPAAAVERTEGLIGGGTKWATPYYVVDSKVAGPAVMITGGMHGNEPAGARAAEQIRSWTIRRGRLIVIPRLNVTALDAGKRLTPGAERDCGNLNRNFPKTGQGDKARGPRAKGLWAFVKSSKPDWLGDLHEGFDFHKSNPKSTGASIISLPKLKLGQTVKLMLEAVNASISDEGRKIVPLRGSANGSLARAAAERLGARTMILETCCNKQPISLRTRRHRIMVHRLLKHLKMVDCKSIRMVGSDPRARRIAIYNGPGASQTAGLRIEKLLRAGPGALVRLVGPQDIADGVLAGQFDAVVFGGGSGSGQSTALGQDGRKAVRAFVKGGGGYLGICGGAYLATSKYKWGLKIIDARTVDSKHWKRGVGKVKMEFTKLGTEILGGPGKTVGVHYANGPLLGPCNRKDIDDYRVLAHFRGEINKNNAPKGVMMNSPAMILGRFGSGKVILFSPHPEKSAALEGAVGRAVGHVSGQRPWPQRAQRKVTAAALLRQRQRPSPQRTQRSQRTATSMLRQRRRGKSTARTQR